MPVRDHFRAHTRRRVELGASLRARDGRLGQPVRVRDLGLGGAGIELLEADDGAPAHRGQGASVTRAPDGRLAQPGAALDREALVTVELTAPTLWDPLVLRGKIAWIRRAAQGRPTRAGVRFEHREQAALYALFQLLEAYR